MGVVPGLNISSVGPMLTVGLIFEVTFIVQGMEFWIVGMFGFDCSGKGRVSDPMVDSDESKLGQG